MILNINIGIAPPDVLGQSIITVPLGSTVTITRSMLMSSYPLYHQVQGYDLGAVKITGHDGNPNALLALNNQPSTIGWLDNDGQRVWIDGSGLIYHDTIYFNAINNNKFSVTGVQLGSAYISYEATAILTDFSSMSEFSQNVNGKIKVNVVPVANLPPSHVDNNTVNVNLGSFIVLDASVFLVGYTDPENDPASMVRVNTIPNKGLLLLNGIPVTVGMIIPVSTLALGSLIYITDPNTQNIGDTESFLFSVSDVGSGQFYG